jgi:peroxiredoxin
MDNGILQKGIKAPDFTLFSTPDQSVSLKEFLGQRLILAFYPADWSPVCGDQMGLYNEMHKEFHKYKATVVGISVDSKWCHMAFANDRKLHFPLLADFEPKGGVGKLYGVYDEQLGEEKRALFLIDETGIIQWSYLSPVGLNPGADGIIDALDELSKTN